MPSEYKYWFDEALMQSSQVNSPFTNRREMSGVEEGDWGGKSYRKELWNAIDQIMLCTFMNIPQQILFLCISAKYKFTK